MLLGLDISTTGAKAILINQDGDVIGSSTHTYPLSTPKPLWSEQDPEDWWQATQDSIGEVIDASGVDPKNILGIGLTGQMHGLVILDIVDQVLRPAHARASCLDGPVPCFSHLSGPPARPGRTTC